MVDTMSETEQRWRAFEKQLTATGLRWALHYAPAHLRWTRHKRHPRGASFSALPDDYRAFVAAVGYPVVGFGYYDAQGITLVPPEAMASLSVELADPEGEFPEARAHEPTACRYAFFAGFDLADVEGWAFGPDGAVWLVEGGSVREPVGSFGEWLAGKLGDIERRIADSDEATRASWRDDNDDETDPHRLIDYSLDKTYDVPPYTPEDLTLAWVEHQDGSPYEYGLIDDAGNWHIPMGRRFYSVRPFRDGVAEVILNQPGNGYGGPWNRIRVDGTTVG